MFAHAVEEEIGSTVSLGHESVRYRRLAPIRYFCGENILAVDGHRACVADPARIATVLIQGETVAHTRLKPNHRGGAVSRNVQGEAQMRTSSRLRQSGDANTTWNEVAVKIKQTR